MFKRQSSVDHPFFISLTLGLFSKQAALPNPTVKEEFLLVQIFPANYEKMFHEMSFLQSYPSVSIMTKRISSFSKRFPALCFLLLYTIFGICGCAPTVEHITPVSHTTPMNQEHQQGPPSKKPLIVEDIQLTLVEDLSLSEPPVSNGLTTQTEEIAIPEPEETVVQEVEELEKLGSWEETIDIPPAEKEKIVKYDFPITRNRQVEYYLDFFQNKNRKSFERWLKRSGRYLPMIHKELQEAGLPLDLAYLPMIESGYSLVAYSRARAVGPWQFMRATARHFGLTVDNYVDERRDPVKSTRAAISYLKCLYEEFNSWELAVAGYNAGEGRIRKGIKKYKTNDFWKLAERRFLPAETKRYVPKLIAAILIAKEPKKYGFDGIELDAPLNFEYAQVPRWTSLRAIAVATHHDFAEIHDLNRELRKQITPPDQEIYQIKIPKETKQLLADNLPRVHVTVTTVFKNHTVRKGETLSQICKQYNLNKTTILKANDLRHSKMPAGKILRIPFRETQYVLLSKEEMNNQSLVRSDGNFILHKIKPGETVAQVARRYKVSPHLIAAWNGLKDINKIRAGHQLALYVSETPSKESLVSRSTPPQKSRETSSTDTIPILSGSSKKKTVQKASAPTYYQVQGGDSLWKIAKRFNLQAEDIARWNNLKNDLIHPGLTLLLKI